nr:hypothetical protein [uncultured Draconibacterium sp.]
MENKCENCIMHEMVPAKFNKGATVEKDAKGYEIAGSKKPTGFNGYYPICLKNENIATGLKTDCALFSDKSLEGAEAAAEDARANDYSAGDQTNNFLTANNL